MRSFFFLALLALLTASAGADDRVRVAGSGSLVQPFIDAAPALRKMGIDIKVTADSNSPNAIAGVGADLCDLALSTRPLMPAERANFPDRAMTETKIGYQALCFSVSADVWQAGLRSLSREEMQQIYEGKTRNWKVLGGPDRRIKFLNPEQGKGVWEFFANWLYGDMRKAPTGSGFEVAGSADDAQTAIEFTGGTLGILPPARSEGKGVHALGIREEDGGITLPTLENVRSARYPITRPVIAVTAYRPVGALRKTLEFMLSAPGQAIVKATDMVPVLVEKSE